MRARGASESRVVELALCVFFVSAEVYSEVDCLDYTLVAADATDSSVMKSSYICTEGKSRQGPVSTRSWGKN